MSDVTQSGSRAFQGELLHRNSMTGGPNSNPSDKAVFEARAPLRRKEMARQISEATTDATCNRRLAKVLDQLG